MASLGISVALPLRLFPMIANAFARFVRIVATDALSAVAALGPFNSNALRYSAIPSSLFPPGNKPSPENCDFPATLVSTRRHGADVRSHRNTFSGERNTAQVVPAPAMRPDFSREYRARALLHLEKLWCAATRTLPSSRSIEWRSPRSQF